MRLNISRINERVAELKKINEAKKIHDKIKRVTIRIDSKTLLLVPNTKNPFLTAKHFSELLEEYRKRESLNPEPFLNK